MTAPGKSTQEVAAGQPPWVEPRRCPVLELFLDRHEGLQVDYSRPGFLHTYRIKIPLAGFSPDECSCICFVGQYLVERRLAPSLSCRTSNAFSIELLHYLFESPTSINLPEDEWVYGYIMSFGCYVEVLKPQRIRDIIRQRTKKILELYQE